MRRFLALIPLICLCACSGGMMQSRDSVMDAIERKLEMPLGARTLNSYARAYAKGPNDRIVAVYFVPGPTDAASCRMALEQGAQSGQVAYMCPPPKGMAVGERRWFDDYRMLPVAFDAGCDWVDIVYKSGEGPIGGTVERAMCHGDA